MQAIFANSSIGTDAINPTTDVARTGLNCATAAELTACKFVKTDGISFVVNGALKFGLAHVRLDSQVPGLDKLKTHVAGNLDVYLIGGFALQPGPADEILNHYSRAFGYGLASGVNQIYGHVKKSQPFTAGRIDDTGHVPGFVALVGPANSIYSIGTHSLLGCVGVLVVPQNTAVTIKKIHLYDATNTVHAIGAHNTQVLTTQLLV